MANLKNTGVFDVKTQEQWIEKYGHGTAIVVGNNRKVTMRDGIMFCSLHGSDVVTWCPKTRRLEVSTCGYTTTTTVSAIGDFCGALQDQLFLGAKGFVDVSRAGDEFTARIGVYHKTVKQAAEDYLEWLEFKASEQNITDGFAFDMVEPLRPKLVGE